MYDKLNLVDEAALEDIAIGAALLGSGGGGDPYIGRLMALNAIKRYGPVKVSQVEDCSADRLAVSIAMMGAPSVIVEKIPNGNEFIHAFTHLERHLGEKIAAVYPVEIGGINSVIPILVAAQLGLPLMDCDPMGRAFPELHMTTFNLNGVASTPMAIADEKGNVALLETIGNKFTESFARSLTIDMGAIAAVSLYPIRGEQLRKYGVKGSLSVSAHIGRTIRRIGHLQNNLQLLLQEIGGYYLFSGKVVDISKKVQGGFNFGTIVLEGLETCKGKIMHVEFQNENLIAMIDKKAVAITPDLISLVDLETLIPFTTESLKYGKRVHVIGLKCDPQWRTAQGLKVVGPQYFGYDVEYAPIETLKGSEDV